MVINRPVGAPRTYPDGQEGDGDEDGGGDGAHGVAPAAAAVHEPVEQAQAPLQQRRVLGVEDDLEVALNEGANVSTLPASLAWHESLPRLSVAVAGCVIGWYAH